MAVRRTLWVVISGLAVLVVIGASVLGWALLRPRLIPAALVVSDEADSLRLHADGRTEQVLATDLQSAPFRFPAISPDGNRLAYVANDGKSIGLMVQNVQTGERKQIYSSQVAQPFDIAWSPDSRYLVFLAPGPTSLVLLMVPADGSAEPTPIITGQTIYFAWSADSKQLVLHVDGHAAQKGRIALYTPGESEAKPLLDNPGFFQAPAFSHDGAALFYVAQPPAKGERMTLDDVVATIVRVGSDGKNPTVLASEPQAGLRLLRAPNDDTLAYSVQRISADGSATWAELKLLREGNNEPVVLSQATDQVEAFFWSPDGRQIAYIADVAGDTGTTRRLKVVTIADGKVRDLAAFTPSAALAELIVYFDAYAHAYSPWSPDGTRLAYAATDGVYSIALTEQQPQKVAAGNFALWARR